MESGITKESTPAVEETQNVKNTESVDSFQSFIYELFEKNGILNDLRAYLRGHIVNVLKSAQTGDPPPCQKHFTQRLELTYQALNILIAEYLMRLEFSYSFSVFISEIPLANMVFGFAKSLMERRDENAKELKFKDTDVWSILNYLGVQCDSEHASNIVEMYKNEKHHPLLLCILKCMPMYKESVAAVQISSEESLPSTKTLESIGLKSPTKIPSITESCKHYHYCKTCQNKMYKIKDVYKKKKKHLAKYIKEAPHLNAGNTDSLVKNINAMEKSLIDEMFQQLKSVYEEEMEMVKVEEEKKVKRSMASHVLQLQKKKNEMEETFKAREAELERSVKQKKRFLWGLARALRDQHAHMRAAMYDVRAETQKLELKEDSLKSQLAEAEQILKKRGEEMRLQISDELTILEGHLESMKKERENITRERSELESIKTVQDTNSKVIKDHDKDNYDIHSHYDLLKNELAILRKYLESTQLQAKCVIERGTVTEPSETTSKLNTTLNNTQGNEKCSKSDVYDDRLKTNQVVNDFRKKNVNFSQSNLDEIYRDRSRERSHSSNTSSAGDTTAALPPERHDSLIQRLREENDTLKLLARQQQSHIEELESGRQVSVESRPRTAPAAPSHNIYNFGASVSANTLNVGWRKGAGEELSVFSNASPRILVPGDTLPFIGVLRDRHGNARRPLLGQGRGGRHRSSPLSGVTKRSASPLRDRLAIGAGSSGVGLRVSGARLPIASCSLQPQEDTYQSIRERLQQRPRTALSLEMKRDKSPKSMLKEAKEKLRTKDHSNSIKCSSPVARDKSPNSVLREAKLRLRKLEIEAEAVEQSYLDFRRRQSQQRVQRTALVRQHLHDHYRDHNTLDTKKSHSIHKLDETTKNDIEAQFADLQKSVRSNFEKYIREYKNRFEIGVTRFKCKPTAVEKVKPIPEVYTNITQSCGNYLETPLAEFRKLYTSVRHVQQVQHDDSDAKSLSRSIPSDHTSVISRDEFDNSTRNDMLRKAKHNKHAELEILKENINKMYNLPNNHDSISTVDQDKQTSQSLTKPEENMLRVEVESISEVNDIKSHTQELLVVVQSSVNEHELSARDHDEPTEVMSAQVTIIVSPKNSSPHSSPQSSPHSGPRSLEDGGLSTHSSERHKCPEQAAHLTRNDVFDAIFHADPNNHISSVQMQLELSKDVLEDSISEYEKGEYPDDLSADVDNYNSRSDYENHSPISLPKTSEDDNFWDDNS